jgi:circadian clock protein KaiB
MVKNERSSRRAVPYVFTLYIAGASPNSSKAIFNLKAFFEEHLKGSYDLEIIDVHQQPHVVKSVDIIAMPLLIKQLPLPRRKFIGSMSDNSKLLESLNLEH